MYSDVLKGMMGDNPASLGTGPAPALPGLPPAPTGLGPMPTGNPGTTQKMAADQAILALRQASGFFPQMAQQINSIIDQLKSYSKESAPQPVGVPKAPGAPIPTTNPLPESGSEGNV